LEALQKVFKTLSDPTRVRVLALLEQEELAVQELMDVLGMAQSRVSRHLAILREAGLLRDRRDGTYVFYRFAPPAEGPWREAWQLVRQNLDRDPTRARDVAALSQVMAARADRTRSFFDAVGPEWDSLRKVFGDDALRSRAVTRLVAPGLRVADVGTGTGILAGELARLGLSVIAVDHSPRMLDAARAKFAEEGLDGVELRLGEAGVLPIETGYRSTARSRTWCCTICRRRPRRSARWRASYAPAARSWWWTSRATSTSGCARSSASPGSASTRARSARGSRRRASLSR
jgi:ArsR family transcriptional regulator